MRRVMLTNTKEPRDAPVVASDNAKSEGCDGSQADITWSVATVHATPKYGRHGNGASSSPCEAVIGR